MICRNRDINNKAKEVKLAVCLGAPDVKDWLKGYLQIFAGAWSAEQARGLEFYEVDLRRYLEGNLLVVFEEKWSQQLSGWAWSQMVGLGYLVASGTREGVYFLTTKGLNLAKWAKPTPDNFGIDGENG